jgi:hypothetical protein
MVASFRGIERVEAVPMKEAGALIPVPQGGFIVFVNESDSKGRQRFSCKHEVCHTFFPNYLKNPTDKRDLQTGEYGIDAEEEYLCDVGAAELLLPRKFFHPALRDMGCSIEAISELARLYEASYEAVAMQLVEAALRPCAVIVWHHAHKPAQRDAVNSAQGFLDGMDDWAGVPKKLRTKYARVTPDFPHFFPTHKSVEEDSPIHHCYLTEETCKGEANVFTGNSLTTLYTESMFIPFIASDGSPVGKVITLILPSN